MLLLLLLLVTLLDMWSITNYKGGGKEGSPFFISKRGMVEKDVKM